MLCWVGNTASGTLWKSFLPHSPESRGTCPTCGRPAWSWFASPDSGATIPLLLPRHRFIESYWSVWRSASAKCPRFWRTTRVPRRFESPAAVVRTHNHAPCTLRTSPRAGPTGLKDAFSTTPWSLTWQKCPNRSSQPAYLPPPLMAGSAIRTEVPVASESDGLRMTRSLAVTPARISNVRDEIWASVETLPESHSRRRAPFRPSSSQTPERWLHSH